MTIERFVAVWFPLRVGRIYTRKKALCVLGLFVVITSVVYMCYLWIVTEVYDKNYGYQCKVMTEYQFFIHKTLYWIDAVYATILPCCLVLTGNVLIIVNIRRARRAQRHLTSSYDQRGRTARDQKQITIMLIVVSVVFLVLNIPNAAFYLAKINWKPDSSWSVYEKALYSFYGRLVHILSDSNHAVNFYLYFLR